MLDPKRPPHELESIDVPSDKRDANIGGFFGYNFITIAKNKDGEATLVGLGTSAKHLKRGATGGILYPPLRSGEIVPIFNYLFKVEVEPDPNGYFAAKWIHPDKFPPGVKLDLDSVAVPLARTEPGHAGFHGRSVRVREIEMRDKKLEATVSLEESSGPLIEKFAVLRAGDVLDLGRGLGKQVRRIVPPDKKTRIIGWVEFEPDTLGEEEMKKFTGRIVRPVKIDKTPIDR
ncbi:MAG: hypothetical protein U0791_09140 [Gemmataceae bacterium]